MDADARDEWVDVVDDEDRVVDRTTRSEIRRRNLLHRATYVLVLSSRGQVFVHRRTESKDVFPGYHDVTIGGVVAAGEGYDDAAVRELAEELGIVGAPLERVGPLRYADAQSRVHGMVYVARHDGPFILQAEEIASGGFVSVAEAERIVAGERCCPDGALVWRTYGAAVTSGS